MRRSAYWHFAPRGTFPSICVTSFVENRSDHFRCFYTSAEMKRAPWGKADVFVPYYVWLASETVIGQLSMAISTPQEFSSLHSSRQVDPYNLIFPSMFANRLGTTVQEKHAAAPRSDAWSIAECNRASRDHRRARGCQRPRAEALRRTARRTARSNRMYKKGASEN